MISEKIKKKLSSNGLRKKDYFIYVFRRGVTPFLRSLFIFSLNFRRVSFPFFLGKKTRIIHSNYLRTGSYCYIGDFSYINCLSKQGVVLGERVTIREFAWLQITSNTQNLGEGIKIGKDTYIGPRCNLGAAAFLEIGERCQIGAGVSFIAENHQFSSDSAIFEQGVSRVGITIENDCWIGNSVIILDGVSVGEGAVIGAGSVVTKDIPSFSVVVGNPARIIKMRK
ncbi:acyltransferase [Brenneria goodwinii]|uniref:acyltransferase n=1 Tax=Brenneria goodwinii TaxID=1109412 RepID=UPI0036E8481B